LVVLLLLLLSTQHCKFAAAAAATAAAAAVVRWMQHCRRETLCCSSQHCTADKHCVLLAVALQELNSICGMA
jgi:hypothetical protein